jgi:transcriptional regulator with XRE-family HTH domain
MRKKKVDPAPSLLMILVRHLKGWFEKGELARILGVTPSQVTMWERRDRAVPIAILERTFDKAEIPGELITPALRTIRAFVRAAQGRSRPDRAAGVSVAADTLPLLLSVADLVLEPLTRSRRDRIETEELWARLKRHNATDRRVLVEDGQDYQSWALCEKVAAESRAAAASDPREALSLAELAVHIAERIPGETAWRRRVKELLDPAVVARIEAV